MIFPTIVIFSLIACFSQVDASTRETEQHFSEECMKETGVDYDIMEKFKKELKTDHPIDSKLQCFVKCLSTKLGVVSETGVFDFERILKKNSPGFHQIVRNAFNKCTVANDTSVCAYVFNFYKCFHEDVISQITAQSEENTL